MDHGLSLRDATTRHNRLHSGAELKMYQPSVRQAPQPLHAMHPQRRGIIEGHVMSGFLPDWHNTAPIGRPVGLSSMPHPSSAMRFPRYTGRIFDYLREAEQKVTVDPAYMESVQTQVTQKMRTILIDWLVDVNLKYKCRQETFFLTVNLIDRYLARRVVMKSKLQLLGCACMMIAAKFEEMFPPEVTDYIHISANTYTVEEMLQMEASVLSTLEYRLALPTAHAFVKHFVESCADGDNVVQGHAAMYVAEHCQLCYPLLRYPPSMQAAACVSFARMALRKPMPHPPHLTRVSRYTDEALKDCVALLKECMKKAPTHRFQALRKKYTHSKYSEVAKKFDRWAVREGDLARRELPDTVQRPDPAQLAPAAPGVLPRRSSIGGIEP
eukprot:TRINITY_DN39936_c0_g1_i1.p2 TRINITY_DN39936_c0_g1~~TRINITY_DN39936_c0_g1_i1.p2  ORF type:complete len:383 (+),score=97.31 TRINITY_DN39936_c0_g1_i1:54-1202(+)